VTPNLMPHADANNLPAPANAVAARAGEREHWVVTAVQI